jgi:hypothetical protein
MRAFLFSRKWKICCRIIPHLGGLKNVPRRTVRQQIVSIKNFRRQIFLCKIYKPKNKRRLKKIFFCPARMRILAEEIKNTEIFYVFSGEHCLLNAG